jgi:predicted nuclease of predicted toxin-antitoxin system
LVLSRANADERLLVTLDKDFGELVFRLGRISTGVLLLRLSGLASSEKAAILSEALSEHGNQMPTAFTVITPGLVRIRPPL